MQDPRSSVRAGAIGGRGGRGSNIDRTSKYKSTPFISKLTSLSSSSSTEAQSPTTSTIVTDIETTTNNNNNDSIRNTNQEIEDLNQTNNYNDINNNIRSNSLDSNMYKVDSHDVLSVASNDSNSSSLSVSSSSVLPVDSTSSDFISSFTITARVPQKMTPKTIQKKLPLISNNSVKNSSISNNNSNLHVSIGGIANNNNNINGSINDVVNSFNNNNSNSINNYNSSSVSTQVVGSSASSSVAMIYNNRPLPTPIIKTEIDKIDTQNQVKTLRELFNREDSTSANNGLPSSLTTSDFKQTPFKNHSLIPTQPQTLPPRTSHHLSLMLHSNNQNFTTSYTDDNIDMKGSNYNDVVTPAKRPSYTSTQCTQPSSTPGPVPKSSTPGPVPNALRRPTSLFINQNNVNVNNNINNVITNNINNNNILLNTRSSTGNDVASRCAAVLNISKTEFLALEPEPPVIEDQYTYKELVRRNYRKEYDDLVQSNLEQYLTDEEFMIVFGRTKVTTVFVMRC
jgi:hypothetical protein